MSKFENFKERVTNDIIDHLDCVDNAIKSCISYES